MHDKEIVKRIIYEDNHLLVFNKPSGMLVQGDKTGDTTLIDVVKHYIKHKYDKPGNVFLGLTHRLDRPVSGAVIFAKTSKALTRVTVAFQKKQVSKFYLAISASKPKEPSGTISNFLRKDKNKNLVKVFSQSKSGAKSAESLYELLQYNAKKSLIKVIPKTGRSHQIRVHLSSLGCPILGDVKYGAPSPLPDKSVALHCAKMSLLHPVLKEDISFTAILPDTAIWSPYTSFLDKI